MKSTNCKANFVRDSFNDSVDSVLYDLYDPITYNMLHIHINLHVGWFLYTFNCSIVRKKI